MRNKLLILITIIISGQEINGQINTLNRQYHLSSRGSDTCIEKTYQGRKSTFCYEIGLWEYWYKNGSKELEILQYEPVRGSDSIFRFVPVKYLNMWLSNGEQILRNGIGFYYELQGQGHGIDYADSLVYQITDSIKHGKFERYRSYKYGPYFLIQSGQFDNNEKTGMWKFRDTVRNISNHSFYINGKKNGVYESFYINGKLKEKGQYLNDIQEGNWKYYDENEKLSIECNYFSGRLFGKYSEYYPNGCIKVTGELTFTNGKEIHISSDLITGKIIENEVNSDRIVVKNGEWKYFKKNGRLFKTKYYNNGVRSKNL